MRLLGGGGVVISGRDEWQWRASSSRNRVEPPLEVAVPIQLMGGNGVYGVILASPRFSFLLNNYSITQLLHSFTIIINVPRPKRQKRRKEAK